MKDTFSRVGASRLVETIIRFWTEHGHKTVRAWTYRIEDGSNWGVRSNLVNGLPPKAFGKTISERRREFLG